MDLGNTYSRLSHGYKTPFRPKIKINKMYPDSKLPTYGSKEAACADLYAYIKSNDSNIERPCIVIRPHETVKIGTGLRMAPPDGWYVQIFARSGLATKTGLAPANKVGICDTDYRGEYIVALHNHSDKECIIEHGDRIAQMALVPYWQADFEEVSELDETERGAEGFGSTGKQ